MSTMTTEDTNRDDRAAIDKAFSLLVSFGDQASSGLGVSELARRADLSKSTAFRVLKVLERNGIVERVGSSYRFGMRLHQLGSAVYAPQRDQICETLTPFLADLYEMTRATVQLAALHGGDVVYMAKLYGHSGVPTPSRVGGRVPAHCTAVGKVLLAFTPEAYDAVLSAPLTAMTPGSITDPSELSAHLLRIRQDGIAFDHDEAAVGLNCVAAPVLGASGRPVAGLSVSGPTGAFDPRAHAVALRRVSHAATQALRRAGVGSTLRADRALAS